MESVESKLLSLDIYREPGSGNQPVVIYVHGGGWLRGDKSEVGAKPGWAKQNGFLLVSVNYQLSPAVRFPSHPEDVAAAIAWIHRNAMRYGGDPRRIYLVGHSAGCHLVALVATEPRYLRAHGMSLADITGVVALDSMMYDIPYFAASAGSSFAEVHRRINTIIGEDRRSWEMASPFSHVKSKISIPPFAIPYSSGLDGSEVPIRKATAERFAAKLLEAGVPVLVIPSPEKTHAQINREFGAPSDRVAPAAMTFLTQAEPRQ
jgi:acetyl esterase/lipase